MLREVKEEPCDDDTLCDPGSSSSSSNCDMKTECLEEEMEVKQAGVPITCICR